MGITGKYDFPGIKKWGAKGVEMLLATTSWGAWVLAKLPFVSPFIDWVLEQLVNYLANKGLVLINIGAIVIDGEFDQNAFDSAMDKAISASTQGNLSDAQKKVIDDTVIAALRKFGPVT